MVGSYFGAAIGMSITGLIALPTGGTSLLISGPIIVGTSATGGYYFEQLAKQIETALSNKNGGNNVLDSF